MATIYVFHVDVNLQLVKKTRDKYISFDKTLIH